MRPPERPNAQPASSPVPAGCIRSMDGENSDGTQDPHPLAARPRSAADSAAASVKDIGLAKHEAIDVLALDDKGQLKVDKLRAWSR